MSDLIILKRVEMSDRTSYAVTPTGQFDVEANRIFIAGGLLRVILPDGTGRTYPPHMYREGVIADRDMRDCYSDISKIE